MSAIGVAASRISLAIVAGRLRSWRAAPFSDAGVPTLRPDQRDELNLAEVLVIELVLGWSELPEPSAAVARFRLPV